MKRSDMIGTVLFQISAGKYMFVGKYNYTFKEKTISSFSNKDNIFKNGEQ